MVGGGDSAVEEAMYLTKFGRKVTLIHRRNELRAAKSIQEKAFANPKMEFMWDTVIEELKGDDILTSMVVKNVKTGEVREIEANPKTAPLVCSCSSATIPSLRSSKARSTWSMATSSPMKT